jgi:hypothetical protein
MGLTLAIRCRIGRRPERFEPGKSIARAQAAARFTDKTFSERKLKEFAGNF